MKNPEITTATPERTKELLEKMVIHSNGLSIWVRMDHGEKLPENLKKQLRELYHLQMTIEAELNLYKLRGATNETETRNNATN